MVALSEEIDKWIRQGNGKLLQSGDISLARHIQLIASLESSVIEQQRLVRLLRQERTPNVMAIKRPPFLRTRLLHLNLTNAGIPIQTFISQTGAVVIARSEEIDNCIRQRNENPLQSTDMALVRHKQLLTELKSSIEKQQNLLQLLCNDNPRR